MSSVATILLGLGLTGVPVAPGQEQASFDRAEFEAHVEAVMESWQLPGLAVGIVTRDGPLYARGFGRTSAEDGAPVTASVPFPLGSCTQPFTALLLGMLAEEGQLDLDAPLLDVLPTFRLADDDLTPRVTPRDLLIQRTGIPEHEMILYHGRQSRADLVRRLRWLPGNQGFRHGFQGNALTFTAAELAVEAVTGQSWEEALRSRVLEPLGMRDAGFEPRPDAARPHLLREEGPVPIEKVPTGPVGELYASVDDLMAFTRLFLEQGRVGSDPLISSAGLEEMILPRSFVYWSRREVLSPTSYAQAWGVNSYRGHYHVRLGGFGHGYESLIAFFPRDGLGIVLLANRGDEVLSLLSALKFRLADALLGLEPWGWDDHAAQRIARADRERAEAPAPSVPVPVGPGFPAGGAGTYRHPAYGDLTLTLDGDTLRLGYHGLEAALHPLPSGRFGTSDSVEHPPWRGLELWLEQRGGDEVSGLWLAPRGDLAPLFFER